MADRRRIVTIDTAGTVTTVRDLEDSVAFFAVKDSFQVKAPGRNTVMAGPARRYAGAFPVAETHDNGEVSWKALVKGATADEVLANAEVMLGVTEQHRGLFLEWRPDGATHSTFFELRGPAKCQATYSWAQFAGARSMYVDIAVPVAPLARGEQVTMDISSTFNSAPMHFPLPSDVGGDAPAEASVSVYKPNTTDGPAFALIGWAENPGTAGDGTRPPLGIFQAATATNLSGWAVSATDAANLWSGTALQITTSGAGSSRADLRVDPTLMDPDEFAAETVDIEIWARVIVSSTLVSPKLTASIWPADGTGFQARYTAEWGTAGKQLVVPSSGTAYRLTRLGTITMPTGPSGWQWFVRLDGQWAAGSSGRFGVDYVVMVPARSRAVSPSSEPLDAAYPRFLPAGSAVLTKTVRPDLSATLAHGPIGYEGPADTGLGGGALELPVGPVLMVMVLSNVVPDDPTVDTQSMWKSFDGTQVRVVVTPRYWLARGA